MSNFFKSFHSLHLFQLFQADCVYKKSLEDACYLLLQSVSLVFYSFTLFQLFQWKMSNFFHFLHKFIMLQCSAKILLLATCTVILLHRYSVTKCVLPEICSLFMPYMEYVTR